MKEPVEYHSLRNIKDSFLFQRASYGQAIPLIFGTTKVNGKIFWASKLNVLENNTTQTKTFNNSEIAKSIHTITEYNYNISIAYLICEGVIADISRVWYNNDELLDLGNYKF